MKPLSPAPNSHYRSSAHRSHPSLDPRHSPWVLRAHSASSSPQLRVRGPLRQWDGSWCIQGPHHVRAWPGSGPCTNGHLMCAGCFIHLLADARLKEEQATCPNCRCEISKSLCCRNLAVEKAVSELPSECGFCLCQFPRSLLERHQKEECQDRVTQCKYKRIGCPWHGPFHELTVHEAACAHPTKTGNELMEILDEMDQSHRREMQLYNSIFSLLSFEKIGYTGGYCSGRGPPEASEKTVRARAPERAEGPQVELQSWAWTPWDGQAGLHPGPLDLLGSPGHHHCLWTRWGAGVRPEAGLDTENSKKHLLSLELLGVFWSSPAQPTPGGRLRASRAATGSSHTMLPGLGLARCRPV
nr:cysteine and histidine-rich protein 1 isoform X1 [Vicugna pacos]